jgi:hypothetical protein
LCLFDPETGAPVAVIDASGITEMRTGAVTAVGAKYLAPERPKTLGHIGARGSAYWNVRLLDRLFGFEEIRVHSRRPASRDGFAERLSRELGKQVIATADWRSCVEGADIVVEASRLSAPEPMLRTEWIKPGALVVPYGTMSAVELSLTDIIVKIVVDDWGQCADGKFGALRAHSKYQLTEETLHARLGQIVAGAAPGGRPARRPSCSGTAACPCPISHSGARYWPRHRHRRGTTAPVHLTGHPAALITGRHVLSADLDAVAAPMLRECAGHGTDLAGPRIVGHCGGHGDGVCVV